ncbi:MAG: gamma-glutamyltransferase [Pseudomonadota bacterium]
MARHAIACGHAETAAAADLILRDGGNATDAAIAAALAAMVAEPVLAGLLGGGFALVIGDSAPRLLDFFVQTPRGRASDIDFRSVLADFGTTTQEFHIGAGAIATPGVASGLSELHRQNGHMPFHRLTEPAASLAKDGVKVSEYQAALGQIVRPILMASAESRDLHCDDHGPRAAGSVHRNAAFADVLETFGREGARFVMEGEVAAALIELTREGGHLLANDLLDYAPVWREPMSVTRGGAEIALNPPPSLGGTLVALSLALADHAPKAVELARLFETISNCREETANDPSLLAAPSLVERYRKTLSAHAPSIRGTTQISVIDIEGNAVSITLSNGEGCGLIVPGTGIMPNNMLGEGDLVPGDWHDWPLDKRLASMMCPLAVRWPDGRLAVMGSGGSNRIRTALAQVLFNLIDREVALEEAINAPRLHVEGARLDYERAGTTEEAENALRAAFPGAVAWPERSMFFGGVHGVMRTPTGDVFGSGDARRAGVALPAAHLVAP